MAKVIPSIQMVLEMYSKIAAVERLRQGGKPGEKTVKNSIVSVKRVCGLGGISLDEPVSSLTRKRLTKIIDAARADGLKSVTVWSYLQALKAVVAHWTRPYYADLKWLIPPIEIPRCVRGAPRYVRPDKAVLAKVKEWYGMLVERQDAREWMGRRLCWSLPCAIAMSQGLGGRILEKKKGRSFSATRPTRLRYLAEDAWRGRSIPISGAAFASSERLAFHLTCARGGERTRRVMLSWSFRAHRTSLPVSTKTCVSARYSQVPRRSTNSARYA